MRYLNEIQISYRRHLLDIACKTVSSSTDAETVFRALWPEGSMDHRESFYALYLSRANQVLSYYRISEGGLAGTVANIKMIFQTALGCNASLLVVAHNHPSGNLRPSKADEELTRKIRNAGQILELPLLDRLILTSEDCYSFANQGLL